MVSVLLAAYNGAEFLPAQLASLQGQACRDFRVLWQDDGSSDGTAALLRAAGKGFVPGREQGRRLGAVGNFLSLMSQDDAEYTALCDQDDVWHRDKLARCMAAMKAAEAESGADTPLLVHHDCRLIGADGALLHGSFFRHQGWTGSVGTLAPLLVQNNVTGCTILMNAALRRLVAAHAPTEGLHMHDWFIALTAAAFGRIVFVDEALADYRQHGRNVMGASRTGLLRRGLAALAAPERAKARIALTLRHAEMFRRAYGDTLPEEAARVIDGYFAAMKLPLLPRVRALKQGGYLMQSRTARLGQYMFSENMTTLPE